MDSIITPVSNRHFTHEIPHAFNLALCVLSRNILKIHLLRLPINTVKTRQDAHYPCVARANPQIRFPPKLVFVTLVAAL
jgi:hypothetical protein